MRNKYLLTTLALIAVGVAGFVALRPPRVNTTEDVFHRIRNGMTEKEVQGILGGPAGDHLSGKYHASPDELRTPPHPEVRQEEWASEGGKITVGFDKNAVVVEKRYESITPMSFLERVRKWLGL